MHTLRWTIVLCLSFGSNICVSQILLKKKEVISRLDQIEGYVQKNDFESAMDIFFNKNEVIHIDNVPKKHLQRYSDFEIELSSKKGLFEENHSKVSQYQNLYLNGQYCLATDLVNYDLNSENSYVKTQKIKSNLAYDLKEAKNKCKANNVSISEWNNEYSNGFYEKVYTIFELTEEQLKYFTPQDLNSLNKLKESLADMYKQYQQVAQKLILSSERIIKTINYENLTYEHSEKYIQELSKVVTTSNSEISMLKGKNPLIESQFQELLPLINKTIDDLKEFSRNNKPLSFLEVSNIVFSSQVISVEFIENKCIEGSADIYNVYNLDVIYYNGLQKKYDTDLKIEVFKETPEYEKLLLELKILKKELLKTTFFVKEEGLFNDEENAYKDLYNIQKKRFELKINDNLDYSIGTIPPKSISATDYPKSPILIKSMPSNQVNVKRHEIETYRRYYVDGLKYEMLNIPINTSDALEIESNQGDIVVYYLFRPSGMEKVKYTSYNLAIASQYSPGWYDYSKNVITSNKLRLLVANRKTGKIYFDQTY